MNIFLTHGACRGNKGDAAIISVMISELRMRFPKANLTLETLDIFDPGQTFEGIPQVHSFYYFVMMASTGQFMRYFRTIWLVLAGTIWAVAVRLFNFRLNFLFGKDMTATLKAYSEADLVVPVGGGYLTAKSGFKNTIILLLRILPIYFSAILGKTIILYSQSVGPFGNSFQEFFAKLAIKLVKAVFVRESISERFLLNKGFDRKKIFLTSDAGFIFDDNKTQIDDLPAQKKLVIGITVRLWFDDIRQSLFEKEIAKFTDFLIHSGYSVMFIPQADCTNHKDDDDRDVMRNVEKILKKNSQTSFLYNHYDHFQTKAIYKHLHILVGMRMHSNIFALASNIPCLAIAYEYKTRGIMEDLGLKEWVIDAQDVSLDNLTKVFGRLVENREAYIDILENKIPEFQASAKSTSAKILELYNQQTQ